METTRLLNNLPIEEDHYTLQQQAYLTSNGRIKFDILMGKDRNVDNSTKTSNSNNSTQIKNIKINASNTILYSYKSNAKGLIINNNTSFYENIIITKACFSLVYSNNNKISQSCKNENRQKLSIRGKVIL